MWGAGCWAGQGARGAGGALGFRGSGPRAQGLGGGQGWTATRGAAPGDGLKADRAQGAGRGDPIAVLWPFIKANGRLSSQGGPTAFKQGHSFEQPRTPARHL